MPNLYRTSDDLVVSRLEDGKPTKLHLENMNLFASGAFSNVYRGIAILSEGGGENGKQQEVVVKKTWPRQRGSPLEVRILGKLNRLKHKNIVRLLYSYQKEHEGKICLALIFEYIPLNLHQHLRSLNRKIDIVEVKLMTWQLFRGQHHLQRMEICHRDMKPQNLLYNADTGLLKITDFGSSAFEARKTPQPSYHVTRYYRPPELLLGSKNYGSEIDIWSCGCIFGELLKGAVFMAGRTSNNQAELIFELLGQPTSNDLNSMKISDSKYSDIWNSYERTAKGPFPNFDFMIHPTNQTMKDRRTAVFNNLISQKDMIESIDLLKKVLVYNPFQRLSGTDFLMAPYFMQIFHEQTVRMNGKRITCLSGADWQIVKIGDKTVTGESTSDIF
ncbi:unnamed protein product [Caenorhabditis angaria]|uniref:Protein kinase domain-containing protein n=1 Tax=Caenorhabditis angaria TaxID=860376 RepID=A0A9P1N3I4_9PELO|nr:unnamed protein product [Caenorhabditis angaria]